MTADDVGVRRATFWEIAERLLLEPDIERGTLMGTPCLRLDGEFLATVHRKTGHLVIRFDAERVKELITDGIGAPFAPAGKAFSEWVDVAPLDRSLWDSLLAEAVELRRAGD